MSVPPIVVDAQRRSRDAGFVLSCDDEVGRFLAVLAAAVSSGGCIGELGTGAGVGCAWLVHGLGPRTDVEIVSIESDSATAALAASGRWPDFVRLIEGDALVHLESNGPYDLLFPDAPAGKWFGLDRAVDAVRPGGVLVVDDLVQPADSPYASRLLEVRAALLGHPKLISAELAFGSGVIVSVKRG